MELIWHGQVRIFVHGKTYSPIAHVYSIGAVVWGYETVGLKQEFVPTGQKKKKIEFQVATIFLFIFFLSV